MRPFCMLLVLAVLGCGSVTADPPADGGTGGSGGKVGVEATGGSAGAVTASGSGGSGPAGNSGAGGAGLAAGGTPGTAGAQQQGSGGITGGGAGACGSTSALCHGSCVDVTTTANCGSCGNGCDAGQTCTNGVCRSSSAAPSCESLGWAPTGCVACASPASTSFATCSVCSNTPDWFTAHEGCQEGASPGGFLAVGACSACASF